MLTKGVCSVDGVVTEAIGAALAAVAAAAAAAAAEVKLPNSG